MFPPAFSFQQNPGVRWRGHPGPGPGQGGARHPVAVPARRPRWSRQALPAFAPAGVPCRTGRSVRPGGPACTRQPCGGWSAGTSGPWPPGYRAPARQLRRRRRPGLPQAALVGRWVSRPPGHQRPAWD